ncbi:hypothetical protein GGF41_000894 [Coemansia sp. RSA 2531]|nr:hypothetical protein GGF41_000894 [Coemansia sp. RSA 2531]
MPHINDLPATVISQILYTAAATPALTLSQWKTKLPLLAVCQAWAKLALGAVFYHIYVEVAATSRLSLDAGSLWTSNAELFISRGCVLNAIRLMIELSNNITPDHLRHIVLNILKLDCVDWQNINSLSFTRSLEILNHSVEPVSQDEPVVTDIARTVQYFAQNLRNIAELNMSFQNYGTTGKYLYFTLAKFYSEQLQVLRAQSSVTLPISCIPRSIRVLELQLDSSAVRVLPSICGETLKVLKLYQVPRNFAWHHFRYDIFVLPIAFLQLTILDLIFESRGNVFSEDEIQNKVASGACCCDQLRFPALKQLTIVNCTPDCDLLYTDLPFRRLEKVYLFGNIDNIRHCSRLKLTWVRDLSVEIHAPEPDQTAEVYRVTNKLFSDICIGRMASLLFNIEIDPELIHWVNLTKLEVVTVDYTTICKLITRLPNLAELIVHYLKFSTALYDGFAFDKSLYSSANPLTAWGEKLATLKLFEFNNDCSFEVKLDGVQALIRRTSALSQLFVPQAMEPYLAEFIDAQKDCYAHLANISSSML